MNTPNIELSDFAKTYREYLDSLTPEQLQAKELKVEIADSPAIEIPIRKIEAKPGLNSLADYL